MATEPSARSAPRLHPLLRLAGYALGTAVGSMAFNVLSGDYGWRAVGVALLIVTVAAVAGFLRSDYVHPTSTLARRTPAVLLTLAGLAVIAAAIQSWTVPATVVAAGLVAAAVLIPTDVSTTFRLLLGVSLIGFGLPIVGAGGAVLRDGGILFGVSAIGFGVVAGIGAGVAMLRGGGILFGAAIIGGGVAGIGAGVAMLRNGEILAGAAVIGLAMVLVAFGVAMLRENDTLFGAAVIGFGVAIVGLGVATLRGGDILAGVSLVGLGVVGIGVQVATLRENDTLFGAAFAGLGVGGIGLGAGALRDGDILFGAAVIGGGVAGIGVGVAWLHYTGAITQAWSRMMQLTRASTLTRSDTDAMEDATGGMEPLRPEDIHQNPPPPHQSDHLS